MHKEVKRLAQGYITNMVKIHTVWLQTPQYLKLCYIASAFMFWDITLIISSSIVSTLLFMTNQIFVVFQLCHSRNLVQHAAQAKQNQQNLIP